MGHARKIEKKVKLDKNITKKLKTRINLMYQLTAHVFMRCFSWNSAVDIRCTTDLLRFSTCTTIHIIFAENLVLFRAVYTPREHFRREETRKISMIHTNFKKMYGAGDGVRFGGLKTPKDCVHTRWIATVWLI